MANHQETVYVPSPTQLDLPIGRDPAPDRNLHRGGRSFYFFDFDDNVACLDTPLYLFDKVSGDELELSTRRYAEISTLVGKPGPWERYEVRWCDETGSFRRFRDLPAERLGQREQPFIEDVRRALAQSDTSWKGPSWAFFCHAVFNQRPVAIITARGHDPETVRQGIALLCAQGHMPHEPNYLSLYTVSHREVRARLGDAEAKVPVPQLKATAIVRSVEAAFERYGKSPHHRFGISDDDPHNVELSLETMTTLKHRYPDNAFFVIDTSRNPVVRVEILAHSLVTSSMPSAQQLELAF